MRSIVALLLVSALFVLSSCSQQMQKVEIIRGIFKSTIAKKTDESITIIPGDTLVTLSKKYNTTISELIKVNNIKAPYVLKPGKKIIIPKSRVYKIKKNDTVYSIAKCYKISIKEIRDKNKKINEKKMIVGDALLLPYYAKINYCNELSKNKKKERIKNKKNKTNKFIFYWPTKGKIISTFGAKKGGRRNDGINILAAAGNPVRAALSGKVIYKGNELPAWGNLILLKHRNGWTTAYAHLDKFLVEVGDIMKTGDLIGVVGKTGNIDKIQLHFQVRKNSKPVDPLRYLKEN